MENEVAMSTEHGPGPPLNTFIVRFWREPRPGRPYWRGQVQHIQSGEHIAFTDQALLLHFLLRWIQMPEKDDEPFKAVDRHTLRDTGLGA
jgi:hypothetical protein